MKSNIDRLPPHSMEAEQGVLGCCLLSPKECIAECVERFGSREMFYDQRHQAIYACLVHLADNMQPADPITVQQALRDRNQLEVVGGISYLSSLSDAVPSAANLGYYAEIVEDKWLLRSIIQIGTESVSAAYSSEDEPRRIADALASKVTALTEKSLKTNPSSMELVKKVMESCQTQWDNKGQIMGLPTGFGDFDRMTGGLQPGNSMIVAARPSIGKTTWAMNIAENVALDSRLPVGILSLEMTAQALISRTLSSRSRVNMREVYRWTEGDFQKLATSAARVASAPIFIDDQSGINILQAKSKFRMMHQQHGIKLGVIDYLQLMVGTDTRKPKLDQVAECSAGVKGIAKELGIPIILISQLNRELDRDPNRKPRKSDLRDAGNIEQDADLIVFLYSSPKESAEEVQEESLVIPVNALLDKQRDGPTGEFYLTFFKQFTRFEQTSRLEE